MFSGVRETIYTTDLERNKNLMISMLEHLCLNSKDINYKNTQNSKEEKNTANFEKVLMFNVKVPHAANHSGNFHATNKTKKTRQFSRAWYLKTLTSS